MNCGSTNTYKLDKSETEELCNLQYRVNHYGGTMKDAYKCTDCGYHMWYDRDGNLFRPIPRMIRIWYNRIPTVSATEATKSLSGLILLGIASATRTLHINNL